MDGKRRYGSVNTFGGLILGLLLMTTGAYFALGLTMPNIVRIIAVFSIIDGFLILAGI